LSYDNNSTDTITEISAVILVVIVIALASSYRWTSMFGQSVDHTPEPCKNG